MRNNLPQPSYEMTLKPRTDYDRIRFGLITPEGELYSCGYADHCKLVNRLVNFGKLDKNNPRDYHGCVHISDYSFDEIEKGRSFPTSQYYINSKFVTNKQIDRMFDYCLALGIEFDFKALEIV